MSNRMGEALVKAAMQKAQADTKKPGRPRYRYTDAGVAVHGKTCLTFKQRLQLDVAIALFRMTKPGTDERRAAFAQIQALPVTIVPVKHEAVIDHSRYPTERLRTIRSLGGGLKERARAARRAAAMRGDGGTVFANDNEGVSYTPQAVAA